MMVTNNEVIEIVNFCGGMILASLWIPQMFKAYKTKSTRDISIIVLCISLVGGTCIFIYSIYNNIKSFIIPNSFGLTFGLLMIFIKLYYDKFYKTIQIIHPQILQPTSQVTHITTISETTQNSDGLNTTIHNFINNDTINTNSVIVNMEINEPHRFDELPDTMPTIRSIADN